MVSPPDILILGIGAQPTEKGALPRVGEQPMAHRLTTAESMHNRYPTCLRAIHAGSANMRPLKITRPITRYIKSSARSYFKPYTSSSPCGFVTVTGSCPVGMYTLPLATIGEVNLIPYPGISAEFVPLLYNSFVKSLAS